jgi:hypothetical protein
MTWINVNDPEMRIDVLEGGAVEVEITRFAWLRFVEDGDLDRIEQWASFWNDRSAEAEAKDYEISKPIQAEIERRKNGPT